MDKDEEGRGRRVYDERGVEVEVLERVGVVGYVDELSHGGCGVR